MALATLFWMILAGAAGTAARYGVNLLLAGVISQFPYATLLVNTFGTFVLMLLTQLLLENRIETSLRQIIGTGFCGAFTTFSTLMVESQALWSREQPLLAALNLLLNLAGGVVALLLAQAAAGWLVR
jgi:fluoride exporter